MKKLFSTKYTNNGVSVSLLLLRIALGCLMLPHGYNKLINFARKSGTFSDPFGIGGPTSMSMAIFAEFFCAALIIIGLLTRFAAITLIIAMSVALFYSHQADFFRTGEKASLYLAGYLVLLVMGPGKISADRLIGK